MNTTTAEHIYRLNNDQILDILRQFNYEIITTDDCFNKMIATILLFNNGQIVEDDEHMITHPDFAKFYLMPNDSLFATFDNVRHENNRHVIYDMYDAGDHVALVKELTNAQKYGRERLPYQLTEPQDGYDLICRKLIYNSPTYMLNNELQTFHRFVKLTFMRKGLSTINASSYCDIIEVRPASGSRSIDGLGTVVPTFIVNDEIVATNILEGDKPIFPKEIEIFAPLTGFRIPINDKMSAFVEGLSIIKFIEKDYDSINDAIQDINEYAAQYRKLNNPNLTINNNFRKGSSQLYKFSQMIETGDNIILDNVQLPKDTIVIEGNAHDQSFTIEVINAKSGKATYHEHKNFGIVVEYRDNMILLDLYNIYYYIKDGIFNRNRYPRGTFGYNMYHDKDPSEDILSDIGRSTFNGIEWSDERNTFIISFKYSPVGRTIKPAKRK